MTVPFRIGDVEVAPGTAATVELPIARRYNAHAVPLSVRVVHGKKPGPCLFVTAALHGDEINGTEVVRRLVRSSRLRRIRGTLLAVPVVNVYGFLQQTRYLPDRRDLNRCFPGSERGSLAARLAYVLSQEVINRADAGIDLHTGSLHRSNLPQIRGVLSDPTTMRLASAFGAPVMLDSPLREGSLRAVGAETRTPILVYEAGQALRFDELAIRAGLGGVVNVMRALEMLPPPKATKRPPRPTFTANGSAWVRAPESGVTRNMTRLGAHVRAGQVLAVISDPLGEEELEVTAPREGIVIGVLQLPLVHEGDALYHIAYFDREARVADKIDQFAAELTDADFAPDAQEVVDE